MTLPKSESEATRELCRVMETQGAVTYPLVGSSMQPPGWPDRYVATRGGWCGFLEAKRLGGRLRPLQARRIRDLRQRGARVLVIQFSANFSRVQALGSWGDSETDSEPDGEWLKYSEFGNHLDERLRDE